MYGQTGSGKTHTLFGPPKFFNMGFSEWGMCPRVIDSLLQNKDESTTIHISVLEVYFDECFDLLNDKVQVAISGFGKGVNKRVTGTNRAIEV